MKCKACDVALSDQESTRKYTGTDEYADLCNTCYHASESDESYYETDGNYADE